MYSQCCFFLLWINVLGLGLDMYFFSVVLYPIAASLVAGKANVSGPDLFLPIISPPSSQRRAQVIVGLLLLCAKLFNIPKLSGTYPSSTDLGFSLAPEMQ